MDETTLILRKRFLGMEGERLPVLNKEKMKIRLGFKNPITCQSNRSDYDQFKF